ncbi:MAG: DUF4118 domain-containing protein [Methanotrichaceae archaeon]|nr:DUF4118 domain-containing protein [Methanotrichaceae archaeon]
MSDDRRPSPDALLQRLRQEEEESHRSRGRLKIFLGAAAGVGKTYQMLEEARSLREEGLDVVVGLVETHSRKETEDLLQGLEIIPRRKVEHEGIILEELDLDAVLVRHPALVLIDEMAHSNAPGSRHEKRFQDIEEILTTGISVYTTLNIQHIESLNDVVYQMTGVRVKETIPNPMLDIADDLEVVDLPPEELLKRLHEGKVYIPAQAEEAMQRFFRKGNLLGLRELSLRYAAHHVEGEMLSYMELHDILGPLTAGSRLLVCISDSPLSGQLIRVGQRLAADLDAEWFAIHIESPQNMAQSKSARTQLTRNLEMAEELGAKVDVISGHDIADELIAFARAHNITLIVVGLPRKRRLSKIWKGSVVTRLTQRSGPIHVLVIGSTDIKKAGHENLPSLGKYEPTTSILGTFMSILVTASLCWIIKDALGFLNIAMIMLLPVVFSGIMWGKWAGVVASILAVCALDFFFVPPFFTFAVEDIRYLPSFIVFIFVGGITSFLADQLHWQRESARGRARFLSSLYQFSKELMAARSSTDMLVLITKSISEAFECKVRIFLPNKFGQLQLVAPSAESGLIEERELGIATWVFQRGLKAGRGTDTLSSTQWSYLPLTANEIIIGVLGVSLNQTDQLQPEQMHLLESFTNIIAISLAKI